MLEERSGLGSRRPSPTVLYRQRVCGGGGGSVFAFGFIHVSFYTILSV